MKKNRRFLALCAALLGVVMALGACSAASSSDNMVTGGGSASSAAASYREEGKTPMMSTEMMATPGAEAPMAPDRDSGGLLGDSIAQKLQADRKIISTFQLTVETTEFDNSVLFIGQMVEQYGGYIESSSVQGRSIQYEDISSREAYYTLRIPTEQIKTFVATLGDHYNIIRTEESAQDITESYYDSKARLESLESQEAQLKNLLEQGGDLQYILEVHRELANVRYQIESLHSSLQRMDQSVDYATVRIQLQEVMAYQKVDAMPLSFGQRISMAISGSWENFTRYLQNATVSFIYQLPYYIANLFWLAVFVVIFLLVRKSVRRRLGRKPGEKTGWIAAIQQRSQSASRQKTAELEEPKTPETPDGE